MATLHEFLANNRSELIVRCRDKVAERKHFATAEQLQNGVPMFLEQLISILRSEQAKYVNDNIDIPDSGDGGIAHREMSTSATLHGKDMLALGFTVDEVVHNYGDLCQAITDLAVERKAPFSVDEFRTLNRCLDYAIACAVTEFSSQHDFIEADRHHSEENKRMGFFVHELRNLLGTCKLAYSACKTGNLDLGGATGGILGRSLFSLEGLINSTISNVRDDHVPPSQRLFSLAAFISEVEITATLVAIARECRLNVLAVDPQLAIKGNRAMLLAAVINLLQNAFKFTHLHTEVTLACHATPNSILIEVADHCGGLGADLVERMFLPFEQGGTDRSGLGLGLTITQQFVTENGGQLSVRDLPDIGCVFTITLPRHTMPAPPT
ncbi:HAMP domain-containing sensor histidine kinase [Massilia sp. BJB1822]|uniref:sensor histidine kinase n=1 Tax=Massilia sp. BJB1822 TaxID=2744470 RepID=UPI001593EC72|nr:HAMP domain-containing sensor histidine kinase [Massilia sp. BJB1822]NVE00646.1 HAMP domain-containing histidine kinase [Massilia sp. BJB1822]